MKKGRTYLGIVNRVDFPNKGKVTMTKLLEDTTENGGEVFSDVTEEDRKITVVVKGVLPGQTVRFRIIKVHLSKNKAEGMLLKVEKPSDDETEAACPMAGNCGGCSYQTLPYEKQLAMKEAMVKKLMDAVIKTPYSFLPIRRGPLAFRYRNKMEYTFGDEYKDGPLSLGMHKKGSFYDVLTNDCCVIVHEDYNLILRTVLEAAQKTGYRYYHKIRHEGYFRNLVIRRAQKTGEILIHLVTSSEHPEGENDFLTGLTEKLVRLETEGKIVGIIHSRNSQLSDAVNSDETSVLYGQDYFYEELLGLRFKITPFSFFQTNSLGAEVLYSTVREMIGDTKDKLVFDLYSGTGTIAQIAAPVAKKVIGVEIVAEAVEAAKKNALGNGLSNCEFLAGDVLKVIDTIPDTPDIIVLDPPREGIVPKALEKIIAYGVDKLVYISCNPLSLQRDLAVFAENDYHVEKVCPVDMFPGTVHVETVCLLSKLHEAKHHVSVTLDMDEMDLTSAESKATYEEIKKYVAEHNDGMKVSSLNIAQVKRKCGIELGENHNLPKSEDARQPQCPKEKEDAIVEALKAFQMI